MAAFSAATGAQASEEEVGERYRISVFHQSESKSASSSSSSSGGYEYLSHTVAVRSDGVERVYDIPLEAGDEKRLISWQFPVHVLEARDGRIEILNREELEKRRDEWLQAAEIPKSACGTWYFTWNAFQVECDPDAIVETIRTINIQPDSLSDGAPYDHAAALRPGRLTELRSAEDGTHFSAQMPLDPDYIHRTDAENDVIVGGIMQEVISFDDAYAKRKAEPVTGSITIELEAGPDGRVLKRVTTVNTEKTDADGETERSVMTETIQRKRV